MKWRAHHICCVPLWKVSFHDRGEDFLEVEDRIKQTMRADSDSIVEVAWGVDELCQVCPLCQDDRCQSPRGDEDGVRKWDGIILKELGISAGTALSVTEWRRLIRQKLPLNLCQRCQWRSVCAMGDGDIGSGKAEV